ncbi:MAG TPA: hypothetical protein DGT23_07845 [Micromonosporaceae bacterium]|nr:hypothetical protein [Micromonosporaceae bacterium]
MLAAGESAHDFGSEVVAGDVGGGSVGEFRQQRGDVFWGEAALPGEVDVFDGAGSALIGKPPW